MELSNVKEIITPQGNLKKILRGDVVIWSKKASDLKYTIWKNGELIDRVTMSQFVNKIQNGDARFDYGIGAQIMIPYTDPFNDVTYDCPFNFGTFTQYPGKLGLQAGYSIPSRTFNYGEQKDATNNDRSCKWEDSYIFKWLNSYSAHNITVGNYKNTNKGFLSCIPQDFVASLQTIPFKNTECKIFILTASQHNIISTYTYNKSSTQYIYEVEDESEYGVWEYWQNLIGEPAKFNTTNYNYYTNNIININTTAKSVAGVTIFPSIVSYTQKTSKQTTSRYDMVAINNMQISTLQASLTSNFRPACVIG